MDKPVICLEKIKVHAVKDGIHFYRKTGVLLADLCTLTLHALSSVVKQRLELEPKTKQSVVFKN